METLAPIYQEIFFAYLDRPRVAVLFKQNPLWQKFFSLSSDGVLPDFEKQVQGHVYLRRFLFWKAAADYKVISFKKDEHLLIDITYSNFRSSLLITLEEKKEGVILRLDHRSFTGSRAKGFSRYFIGYWKSLFKILAKENSIQ